jgi:glycosyltransferase involved in cell wall biosynthesis
MDLLLFQTKEMVEYFRKVASQPVEWFPTNRPPLSDRHSFDLGESKERVRKFVFVGHVAPRKGVREIIEASSQVEEDIVVDIYGPLRDGLTADEFDGQKAVYRGILPPETVIATLKRYDVLLLPTYHLGEGYPGVILESYCAGIPVIATRWNAIPEIVEQDSGILVEPGDVGGLRDAMLRLIHSPAEYAQLQSGAKEKAQRFSSEVWTERFVELVVGLFQEQDDEGHP